MALHSCPKRAREPSLCTPTSVGPDPGCPLTVGKAVSWSWKQCLVREQLRACCIGPEAGSWVEPPNIRSSSLPGFPAWLLRWESRQVSEGRCAVRIRDLSWMVNPVHYIIPHIFVTAPDGRFWLHPSLCWLSNSCFFPDLVMSYFLLSSPSLFVLLESLLSLYQALDRESHVVFEWVNKWMHLLGIYSLSRETGLDRWVHQQEMGKLNTQ